MDALSQLSPAFTTMEEIPHEAVQTALTTLLNDDPGKAMQLTLDLADSIDVQNHQSGVGTTLHDDLLTTLEGYQTDIVDHMFQLDSFDHALSAELHGFDPALAHAQEFSHEDVSAALTRLSEESTAAWINQLSALTDAIDTQHAHPGH